MYEAIHAHPDGDATVSRQAQTAAAYGFDGVVVRNHSDSRGSYDAEAIATEYGVDVVTGLEIRAPDPEHASGAVGNARSAETIVVIHGGSAPMNRFAVENEKVDVLAHPMAGNGDINHVIAKAATQNGVRLECNFTPVLQHSGGRRVRAIQSLRKLRELIEYYETPYVVSADPHSHLELRAPRELIALGEQLGFSAAWIENGLAEWGRLATRNRTIDSPSFIEPGVTRGQYHEQQTEGSQ